MINFTRAFDTAWERMMIILFRPFDFGKWLIIGLSAFLAGLMEGGNGFNSSFNYNNFPDSNSKTQLNGMDVHKFNSSLAHLFTGVQVGLIIAVAIVIFLIIMVVLLVMYWLGSRGQFLFLDNIVRNRGAVGEPWQRYARQSNSLFIFYLLYLLVCFAIFIPIAVVIVVISIPLIREHRWPVGWEIASLCSLGVLYVAVAIVLGVMFFIFTELGVPLMFRNGLMARPAFKESMRLTARDPGSVAIFVLLRIALAVAVAIVSAMTCCLCCAGLIPYVGTVVLLPALIYVRCFTLDCLAQFGPQYDVFTVDVPPSPPVAPSPFSPPPRLG
jgi:hypothetical protein